MIQREKLGLEARTHVEWVLASGFFWALATVGLVLLLARAFAHLALEQVDPSFVLEANRWALRPKPVERRVFTLCALLVPLGLILWAGFRRSRKAATPLPGAPAWALFWAGAFASAFLLEPSFLMAFLNGTGWPGMHLAWAFVGAVAMAWALCWSARSVGSRAQGFLSDRVIAGTGAFLVGAQVLGWRLFGLNAVVRQASWAHGTDAVAYPISQCMAGKTLLVDLPSQYGLYAEPVALLARLMGGGSFGISAAFALLQVVTMAALFAVILRTVKRPWLKALGILAMIGATHAMVHVGLSMDRALQAQPLRILWPALGLLAFERYSRRPRLGALALVSAAGALGTLWNFESGLFVTVALGAFLCARLAQGSVARRRHLARGLAVHLLVHVIVLVGVTLALRLKGGAWPDWAAFFLGHSIFYKAGHMQLPMPKTWHPWGAALAVILLGILASLLAKPGGRRGSRADLLYFTSVLALGMFFYYSGRSHVLNLVAVSWAFFLVALLLADDLARGLRAGTLPRHLAALVAVTAAVLAAPAWGAVRKTPWLMRSAASNWLTRDLTLDPKVRADLDFIRTHDPEALPSFIFSELQGFYYAETGMASTVPRFGLATMELESQRDDLAACLRRACAGPIFLQGDADFVHILRLTDRSIWERYRVAAKSPNGSMMLLLPR